MVLEVPRVPLHLLLPLAHQFKAEMVHRHSLYPLLVLLELSLLLLWHCKPSRLSNLLWDWESIALVASGVNDNDDGLYNKTGDRGLEGQHGNNELDDLS